MNVSLRVTEINLTSQALTHIKIVMYVIAIIMYLYYITFYYVMLRYVKYVRYVILSLL